MKIDLNKKKNKTRPSWDFDQVICLFGLKTPQEYAHSLPGSLRYPPLRRVRRDPWGGWQVRRTSQQNPWKSSHARIVWARGLRDSNPVVIIMAHSTAMYPVNGSNLQVSTFELSSFSLFIPDFFLFRDRRECFKPPVGRLPCEKDGSARRTWYTSKGSRSALKGT